MGTAFDALQVAVGGGGALTVLAGSISTWLATRRQDVALKLTRSDGEVLRVAGRVKDPSVLIEAFLSAAGADEPGDPVSDSQER
jgi:Effector Associated Constant Component 1